MARDSANANSAVIVSVTPEDFGSDSPLAGVEFQRRWEKCAWEAAGNKTEYQYSCLKDFKNRRISKSYGRIGPIIKTTVLFADLNNCLQKKFATA